MNILDALDAFTHALVTGADSFTLAEAYRQHVTTLHLIETLEKA